MFHRTYFQFVQNFVTIGWMNYGDIAIFWFPIWRPSAILNFRNMQMSTFAMIYSRSVERLRRYCDFVISNMAAVRHFEFLKYANFHLLCALQWQSACSCKIASRSVERLRRYCEFSMSATLNLWNMQIMHGLRLKSVYLYKISSRSVERLQSNYILNILNMAAVRHLLFVIRTRGTTHYAALVVRRSPENFVQIGWIVFEI